MTIVPSLIAPDGRPVEAPEYDISAGIPNVRVVGPRLLVAPAQRRAYTTTAGLYIPENAQEHVQKAVVMVVGDGTILPDGTRLPPCVEAGDEIIYARYAGAELEMDGRKYLVIQESDVRVVLTYKGKMFTFTPDEPEWVDWDKREIR